MASREQPVLFRGQPGKLGGVLILERAIHGVFPLAVDDDKSTLAHKPPLVQVTALGVSGCADIRVHVPRTTPPGRYSGSVLIDRRAIPFVVHVEPHPHIRLAPPRLRFPAEPGGRVVFNATVMNDGNVSVELPRSGVIGLFDTRGTDAAIGHAFLAESSADERGVDRLFEELRKGHGGLAKLRLKCQSATLAPDTAQEIEGTVQIPDTVRAGHTYWGIWQLLGRRIKITIDVAGSRPRGTGSLE